MPIVSNRDATGALSIEAIVARVKEVFQGWPKLIAGKLFGIRDGRLMQLACGDALFAYLRGHARVEWHSRGSALVEKRVLYQRFMQVGERYDAATKAPHFPVPLASLYYLLAPPVPRQTGGLDQLLRFFAPATPIDALLLKAFVLTTFWSGDSGSRPVFQFVAADTAARGGCGVGKSTAVELLSELSGGLHDFEPNGDGVALRNGLISLDPGTARVLRFDNLKTERFSWATFESLVTASAIDGHRLYTGQASVSNYFIWAITVNGGMLSRDMAERTIVIKLGPPRYSPDWREQVRAFIVQHRDEILADVAFAFQQAPTDASPEFRFAYWGREILGRCGGNSTQIAREIAERQQARDADADMLAELTTAIRSEVSRLCPGRDPENCSGVFLPTRMLSTLLAEILDCTTNQVSRRLSRLLQQIPQLSRDRIASARGYRWTGSTIPR
jgi:hypothetical protein